ncbi:MAG: carboxypeptidase-like regulatory domain-containing protein [Nitrospinota bacterium]
MSWALVTENAHVAVTDANGKFSIPDVPPGKYKVKIWHETLGEKVQDLEVKGGATAFNFKMAK